KRRFVQLGEGRAHGDRGYRRDSRRRIGGGNAPSAVRFSGGHGRLPGAIAPEAVPVSGWGAPRGSVGGAGEGGPVRRGKRLALGDRRAGRRDGGMGSRALEADAGTAAQGDRLPDG